MPKIQLGMAQNWNNLDSDCIQLLNSHYYRPPGGGGGGAPGPHIRGKLRGIRSRPTPKGEIEGDQVPAHTQGGN